MQGHKAIGPKGLRDLGTQMCRCYLELHCRLLGTVPVTGGHCHFAQDPQVPGPGEGRFHDHAVGVMDQTGRGTGAGRLSRLRAQSCLQGLERLYKGPRDDLQAGNAQEGP